MGNRVLSIAVLIVAGVIIANLVANPSGTGTLINGISGLWSTSLNALLGQTSQRG